MRTGLFSAILMLVCIGIQGCSSSYAKENHTGERLEISFRFQRGGIASSQYAIWIEDKAGRMIRTLYATSFTAGGGYEYREDALPIWVSKAKPQNLSSAQIDAITGATPQNSVMTYQWDGTDDNGHRVPQGTYTFFRSSRNLVGISFYIAKEFRPLPYGNESNGSARAYRAAFRNTGLF